MQQLAYLKFQQHEVIEYVTDLEEEGLIKNIIQYSQDFRFELTAKAKNTLDEYGSYSNYIQKLKSERSGKRTTTRIQNFGVLFTLVIAIGSAVYQFN